MGLVVENGNWLLQENIIEPTYTKTLRTKGFYLDKDIDIILTPKTGEIKFESTSEVHQDIREKDENHFIITAVASTVITPSVSSGWISSLSKQELSTEGSILLDKTKLLSGLVPDSSKDAGSSYYRVTATEGYNNVNLDKDIDVYQGRITFSEE